ncbi:MAG: hypothetical protein KJ621_15085 [Proteobacteria bacterium]|nr:hypothetical protein [Pseudomonadota bacterium]MBU1742304.1 hypothetical protein [Pseudomonadota bacterium]
MGPQTETDKSTRTGRKKRRLTALYVALIILGCLALVEGAARYIFYNHFPLQANRGIKVATGEEKTPMSMRANAFWHHLPNPAFYVRQLSRFQTRGPDFRVPKPAGEFRIICVGDSTTFGWKNAVVQTYPHYLQEILTQKIPGRQIKVINAGVPGFNSAFALSYLALRLVQLQPDLVIIKLGYNDVFAYLMPGLEVDYTNIFPRPFDGRIRDQKFWRLARHIYILRFIGHWLLDPPVQRYVFGVWDHQSCRRPRLRTGYLKKMAIFRSHLRTMIALCRARRIPVILLDLPYSRDERYYWPAPKAFFGIKVQGVLDKLGDVIERLARDKHPGVFLVRTKGRLGKGDFFDHIHNTARGNRTIARLIAEKIAANRRRLGLSRPAKP